jgi:hypothetical protein
VQQRIARRDQPIRLAAGSHGYAFRHADRAAFGLPDGGTHRNSDAIAVPFAEGHGEADTHPLRKRTGVRP